MRIIPGASQTQIEHILAVVRKTIDQEEFIIQRRTENEETLFNLGFLHSHVIDVIYELTYKDYHKGPEPNISKAGKTVGSVWKFGKIIEKMEVYIKLHVIPFGNGGECVCISFHESDRPMTYPFK